MAEGGSVDPAEARKRRKKLIASQRQEESASERAAAAPDVEPQDEDMNAAPTGRASERKSSKSEADLGEDKEQAMPVTKRQKKEAAVPSIGASTKQTEKEHQGAGARNKGSNSKKAQIRYDPDVPMSKEQLAAWRREARRVRNRESAAASRQRIRSRITELETEVEDWKSKYNRAMDRLEDLQQVAAAQQKSSGDGAGTEAVGI